MKKSSLFFSIFGGTGILAAGVYFLPAFIERKWMEQDEGKSKYYMNVGSRHYREYQGFGRLKTHENLDRMSDADVDNTPFAYRYDIPKGIDKFFWLKRSDINFLSSTSSVPGKKNNFDCELDTDKGIRKNRIVCRFLSFPKPKDKKCNVNFEDMSPFSFNNITKDLWPESVLLYIDGIDFYVSDANINKITLYKNDEKHLVFDAKKLEKADCVSSFSWENKSFYAKISEVSSTAPNKELYVGRIKQYQCKLDDVIVESCSIYSKNKLITKKEELKKDLQVTFNVKNQDYKLWREKTFEKLGNPDLNLVYTNIPVTSILTIESKDPKEVNKVYAKFDNFSFSTNNYFRRGS